jgi:hypothetical protein
MEASNYWTFDGPTICLHLFFAFQFGWTRVEEPLYGVWVVPSCLLLFVSP